MKVIFRDARLEEAIRTASAAGTGYHPDVLRAAGKKLGILEAATDERVLRNWKSLHYEKLDGKRAGQRAVRVNDQYRLVFLLNEIDTPATVEILDLVDYH